MYEPFVITLSGPPACGKTKLARELEELFERMGKSYITITEGRNLQTLVKDIGKVPGALPEVVIFDGVDMNERCSDTCSCVSRSIGCGSSCCQYPRRCG